VYTLGPRRKAGVSAHTLARLFFWSLLVSHVEHVERLVGACLDAVRGRRWSGRGAADVEVGDERSERGVAVAGIRRRGVAAQVEIESKV